MLSRTKALQSLWPSNTGYHFSIKCCLVAALTVFITNLVFIAVALAKFGHSGTHGTLQKDCCDAIQKSDQWLHLLINVLSTLLLGASNYTMQCLSSPTRTDVNKAHQAHIWLDIGVLSLRNLRYISTGRLVLWLLLGVSSIPLHLLYNSAIFSTLSYNEFLVVAIDPAFVAGAPLVISPDAWKSVPSEEDTTLLENRIKGLQADLGSLALVNLTNQQCIDTYTSDFVSAYGDLLVMVKKELTSNVTVHDLWMEADSPPLDGGPTCGWVCSVGNEDICKRRRYAEINADSWAWKSDSSPILGCLAKHTSSRCDLRFSIPIIVIVMFCNLLKIICFTILLSSQDVQPLVTLGDAITSFLDEPDVSTQGQCIADITLYESSKGEWPDQAIRCCSRRWRWFSGASRRRWIVSYTCCILILAIAAGLLIFGTVQQNQDSPGAFYLFDFAFGALTSQTVIRFFADPGVVAMVMLANSPQLILSFLYYNYNSLFTSMLIADEWSQYAYDRKPLRVTSPRGSQRSTYRLQLPYRYGGPLLLMSAVLHWLVSQSIFLASLQAYDHNGSLDLDGTLNTCGWSPAAIFATIMVGLVMLTLGLAMGCRQYRLGIPLARSCSAVISAACHVQSRDSSTAMALKPLLWGDTSGDNMALQIRHCSFSTSKNVSVPTKGTLYAGLNSPTPGSDTSE